MPPTVLFQYPTNSMAESAKAVVTSRNIRVGDRVCAAAEVERAAVQKCDIRWMRIFTIFGSLGIGILTVSTYPIFGAVLLAIGGLLLYTTASGNKWSYWNGVVVTKQTEETVMSGDSSKRFCILVCVEKHIAEEFIRAVHAAVAENGSGEEE